MQAILLAGGFGTRLKGLIDTPKPLTPFNGKPFLAHYIEQLVTQGIDDVTLALHHQAEQFQACFRDAFLGIPIRYSIETTPLGTGGAIRRALGMLSPSAPVFVSNADTWMDLDVCAMADAHRRHDNLLTIAAAGVPDCRNAGQLVMNGKHEAVEFLYPGKPESGLVSMGAYIICPNIFSGYDLPERFSFESDFKAHYIRTLRPHVFLHHGDFLDFGTPETFTRMTCMMAEAI